MPSKRKDGTKSQQKGTRGKAGGRLPVVAEKAVRENQMKTFLREYGKTGRMQHSAGVAGISCRTVQKWRNEYPEFDERYEDSHQQYIDMLKNAAINRAVNGVTNPGKFGDVTTFSDYLLMFLLKQADPSFKDNAPVQVNTGPQINQNSFHGNVTIIEDANWYGNKAHDLATKAVTAHTPSSLISSEIQAPGMRETLEQDRSNDARGSAGTRQS